MCGNSLALVIQHAKQHSEAKRHSVEVFLCHPLVHFDKAYFELRDEMERNA